MKILCNAIRCIWNKEDQDESNAYHRLCVNEEVEIYSDSTLPPICFSFEEK
jgi:hypothetical protein